MMKYNKLLKFQNLKNYKINTIYIFFFHNNAPCFTTLGALTEEKWLALISRG